MRDKGALYIAMSDDFFEEAKISANSLKQHNPEIKTCVITDKEREAGPFDKVKVEEPNKGSDKIYYLNKSPFDQTLFLDTDIYICNELEEVFKVLNQFDIALAHNSKGVSKNRAMNEKNDFQNIPSTFPEFNTGVIIFQKDKIKDISDELKRLYEERMSQYGRVPKDQPVFRKVLYESRLRIATLPTEYNCRLYNCGVLGRDPKIIHSRILDVGGIGLSKKLDVVKAADKLKSYEGLRVFYYYKGRIKVKKRKEKISKIAKNSFEEYGLRGKIIRFLKKLNSRDFKLTEI